MLYLKIFNFITFAESFASCKVTFTDPKTSKHSHILLSFFVVFFFWQRSLWDFSFLTGIEPLAVRTHSPNHWIAREFSGCGRFWEAVILPTTVIVLTSGASQPNDVGSIAK